MSIEQREKTKKETQKANYSLGYGHQGKLSLRVYFQRHAVRILSIRILKTSSGPQVEVVGLSIEF